MNLNNGLNDTEKIFEKIYSKKIMSWNVNLKKKVKK